MNYNKPYLSVADQIVLLESRGMKISDPNAVRKAIARLPGSVQKMLVGEIA